MSDLFEATLVRAQRAYIPNADGSHHLFVLNSPVVVDRKMMARLQAEEHRWHDAAVPEDRKPRFRFKQVQTADQGGNHGHGTPS